jgi:hypothetical protein
MTVFSHVCCNLVKRFWVLLEKPNAMLVFCLDCDKCFCSGQDGSQSKPSVDGLDVPLLESPAESAEVA